MHNPKKFSPGAGSKKPTIRPVYYKRPAYIKPGVNKAQKREEGTSLTLEKQ